jgi:hypothetical protein
MILCYEFIGCLDECQGFGFPVNITRRLLSDNDDSRSVQFISKSCHGVPAIALHKLFTNMFHNEFEQTIDRDLFQDQNLSRLQYAAFRVFMWSIPPERNTGFRFYFMH